MQNTPLWTPRPAYAPRLWVQAPGTGFLWLSEAECEVTHEEESSTLKLAIADALLEGQACDSRKKGANEPKTGMMLSHILRQRHSLQAHKDPHIKRHSCTNTVDHQQ